ncbi:MAG: tetratricopeptide repeat protein [Rhodocyclaceae bacterium]|nr:tetratricopeptide repeat protein [Rhodocyclaceae bacterium]
MSSYAIDVTTADFKEKVFDACMTVPVVVDFWAEWCGPCKVLKPILEKLAIEYAGRFILAKVDSDANPELAGHFGVRSIPTVVALVGGQIVDGFTGAKSEGQIREFLDRFVAPAEPAPGADLLALANTAREAGNHEEARRLLTEAIAADPGHHDAAILLTEISLEDGALDEAEHILTRLASRPGEPDARVAALSARITLIRKNAGIDTSALKAQVEAAPDDHALRLEYANALAGKQDWRGALEQMLSSVRQDKTWGDGAARKAMIELFKLLAGDESQQSLVREFRSKLAGTLN